MAIEKLPVNVFLELAATHPILDVRSPGEYTHAHIPGAHSLPLFTNDERKVVGTAYKQQSRETAIKIGLDYFGIKMRAMVEEAEALVQDRGKTVLLHCWRGGMRSAAVAWLLDLYGFKVYTLAGGYKAYRHWVLAQFEKPRMLYVIGGYTGSDKTGVLHRLLQTGQPVIDLEGIAVHRGSAFGTIAGKEQPTQEMFENRLATQLSVHDNKTPVWLEDESQRIGDLNIPTLLWQQMRTASVWFLDIPFEARIAHIVAGYGQEPKEKLVNAIIRIQKRLGPLETKTAINYLIENELADSFSILLKYYDKQYNKALKDRDTVKINRITCDTVDVAINAHKLMEQHTLA